jgi:hypothetical protein
MFIKAAIRIAERCGSALAEKLNSCQIQKSTIFLQCCFAMHWQKYSQQLGFVRLCNARKKKDKCLLVITLYDIVNLV